MIFFICEMRERGGQGLANGPLQSLALPRLIVKSWRIASQFLPSIQGSQGNIYATDICNHRLNIRSQIIKVQKSFVCQCCGSGSGRIGIILQDPDRDRHPGPAIPNPDLYPFQPNLKKTRVYFFKKIPVYCPKILKIMTSMTLTTKKIMCEAEFTNVQFR